ncbi:hypothetical protein WCD74_13890 [Actinomycetospora sp. OC33-EN08]|uniref:Uncharacterized protein n=1 Tax=Actinomycetospora aurantiaca TaxID=3129233 RepID=A0ABU8MPD7_9PSEU
MTFRLAVLLGLVLVVLTSCTYYKPDRDLASRDTWGDVPGLPP